ncbi:hypothetical protein PYCCODRAFT_1485202 [Trametes coccinea BRFM310]|uniref:Uncharacterized protein n=1 Tax=Trametes coccinea (strain BRFM310) TaxID=1353009 RepID=A0A1Y2J5X1_TRAC3|nr:hypothetical protein PYCCODRAFT_1485202 [Trametes coccinea BRFM310]
MSVTEAANLASPEVTNLNDLLAHSLKTSEDFHALSAKFEEALGRPEVREQARKDIHERTKNAQEMKETFTLIGMGLTEFDNANFLDKDDKPLKLGAQWRELQHRLYTVLDKDHEDAFTVSTFMQIYSMNILADVLTDDRATLREQLQGFVTELDKRAARAVNARVESKRLAEDIRVFTVNVEETLMMARSRLTTDVELDKARLESLHEQMQRQDSPFPSQGRACTAHLAAAGAAGVAISTLSPAAMFLAAACVYDAIGSDLHATQSKEIQDLEQQIKQRDAELSELVAREQLLAKYQAKISNMQKDILSLATKVDPMIQVELWNLVPLVRLANSITSHCHGVGLRQRFMRQVKASRELYRFLAALLDMYGKGQEIGG